MQIINTNLLNGIVPNNKSTIKHIKRLLNCCSSKFPCHSIYCGECQTKKHKIDYQHTKYLIDTSTPLYFLSLHYKTIRLNEVDELHYYISKAKSYLSTIKKQVDGKIEIEKLEIKVNKGINIHFHLLVSDFDLANSIMNHWEKESKDLKVLIEQQSKKEILNYVLKPPVYINEKKQTPFLIGGMIEQTKGVRFLTAIRKNVIKNKEQQKIKIYELINQYNEGITIDLQAPESKNNELIKDEIITPVMALKCIDKIEGTVIQFAHGANCKQLKINKSNIKARDP